MNRCPITYTDCGVARYSTSGLHKLSPRLDHLEDFPYTQEDQIREAAERSSKMSIQGVQPKLSIRLDEIKSVFVAVDSDGRYIIKPQNPFYPELPENEDLTMRMAGAAGIVTPFHGLVYCQDKTLSYFVKRFDRTGRKGKIPVEDFAQLSGANRETKYASSMEQIAKLTELYCTFPAIEKQKLLRLVLFCFLTGNEDMHLKNLSLITIDGKTGFSPAYDFLNTTIAIKNTVEEIALPIKGKKRGLTRSLLLDYFGRERLSLNEKVIGDILETFNKSLPIWKDLLNKSFLSEEMKEKYQTLLSERLGRIGLG